MQFEVGDLVEWLHVMRGGYGYTERITCVVTKIGPKRVQVEAPLKSGGNKLIWVDPTNLRPGEWK